MHMHMCILLTHAEPLLFAQCEVISGHACGGADHQLYTVQRSGRAAAEEDGRAIEHAVQGALSAVRKSRGWCGCMGKSTSAVAPAEEGADGRAAAGRARVRAPSPPHSARGRAEEPAVPALPAFASAAAPNKRSEGRYHNRRRSIMPKLRGAVRGSFSADESKRPRHPHASHAHDDEEGQQGKSGVFGGSHGVHGGVRVGGVGQHMNLGDSSNNVTPRQMQPHEGAGIDFGLLERARLHPQWAPTDSVINAEEPQELMLLMSERMQASTKEQRGVCDKRLLARFARPNAAVLVVVMEMEVPLDKTLIEQVTRVACSSVHPPCM